MSEPMKSVGISAPAELLERIDKERAREGVESGNTPSRSEWWREAAEAKLNGYQPVGPVEAEEGDDVDEAEATVEA